jgi:hypothetical protein
MAAEVIDDACKALTDDEVRHITGAKLTLNNDDPWDDVLRDNGKAVTPDPGVGRRCSFAIKTAEGDFTYLLGLFVQLDPDLEWYRWNPDGAPVNALADVGEEAFCLDTPGVVACNTRWGAWTIRLRAGNFPPNGEHAIDPARLREVLRVFTGRLPKASSR